VKTNKRVSFLVVTAALLTVAFAHPARLSAETAAQWSVEVTKVDPGTINLAPSFQLAIYENVLQELGKTKQFKDVLRQGDRTATDTANLLLLKTTLEKYSPGSETQRAVTTVTGATKLTVRVQLTRPDGDIVLDRTIHGNVRFMGSNMRATHNLGRNIAKAINKSSLPGPPLAAVSRATKSTDSEVVVVEVR
jgi:hypothetical protein